MQIYTAVTVTKYVYIFVVKNPSYQHDNFWCFFVNLWFLVVGSLVQFTYQFLPGRDQLNIYVCSGHLNLSANDSSVKVNYFSRFYLICAIAWYIFAAVRIRRFKKKNYVQSISLNMSQQEHTLAQKLGTIFKMSLANFAIIGFALVLIAVSIAVPAYLSNLDPRLINQAPNYQLFHFSDHGLILVSMFSFTLFFYVKNGTMRKTVLREIRDNLETLKEGIHL
jgi:hypothetical protein